MAVCDICDTPGQGTIVKAGDMSRAVRNGFNPFKAGLAPDIMEEMVGESSYDSWRESAINGPTSTTDWNVCADCIEVLKPYLGKAAKSEDSHTCDFCGKIFARSDTVAMVDDSVAEKMEQLCGFHRKGQASALDPAGRLRWVACQECTNQFHQAAKGFLKKQ
ncbi:MAG: hypothetical protein BWX88_01900 [Planctomycetes bacterium ADurb.Bin126]|nr:MAG: hypothetical protein BWX88_01900 [Planctomycetes bacterium ADurb.Bin126]HOD82964.1 hypothetical protein [Phycisphaerae bacterium]HQL74552.1 hypothetical protein [Phycisphaerae bacterium]